jgi:hypothetical protein
MRLTNILAFDLAALAVGVAIPATAQLDDLKDVAGKTESMTTEVAVITENETTIINVNTCLRRCPEGSHCVYCGFSGRYSIECCKINKPPGQLKKPDTASQENSATDHANACNKVCNEGFQCGFCGRGETQCCKSKRPTQDSDINVFDHENAAIKARDNIQIREVSLSTAHQCTSRC